MITTQKNTNEYYLLYGLKSQLTGKTNVDMNISWLYKTFENNANSHDFNGLNWDIKAEWKPLQQSVFTAHSAQSIKDPSEVGGYILVTQYGLSYQHFWLGTRFSTLLDGLAPIFPYTFYHLTHYWFAASGIPVANDTTVHYADAIRYNARRILQGSLPLLTHRVSA